MPKILVYNHTASLPIGWYLILPYREYQVNDIVVFRPTEEIEELAVQRGWKQPGEPMLKQIGALENMTWQIADNGQFYIGSAYWGQVAEQDSNGRPLPKLCGTYTVPHGNFLPVVKNPGSFDGRYYGTMPLNNILYSVVPLITW